MHYFFIRNGNLRNSGEMNFSVAYSGGNESEFSKQWLIPGNIGGIPQAILIQDNKVVWIAHPEELTIENLQLLVNREFSIEKAEALSPSKKLQDVNTLIDSNKLQQAGFEIDKILQYSPADYNATSLKIKWLKQQGKVQEALDYAKHFFVKYPKLGKFLYYEELKNARKYDILNPLLNRDFKEQPNDMYTITLNYESLMAQNNYSGVVAMINKIIITSRDENILNDISIINKIIPEFKVNIEIQKAMLRAAQKCLMINPCKYDATIMVAQQLWKTNKTKAKDVLQQALQCVGNNYKEKKHLAILNLILKATNEDSFPTDEQINTWWNER